MSGRAGDAGDSGAAGDSADGALGDAHPHDRAPQPPRPPRPPWSEFRAALDAVGFRPSRRLGQNFLLDENLARLIAAEADPAPGTLVLEVGPGCGFLSVHLAHTGARLLAVEIDSRLAAIARRFLAPYPLAEVLETDVLAGKWRLDPRVTERLPEHGSWRVCSNLPYSVSGPFLALLAQREEPPERVCVLVQAEVAERLEAPPGSGARGPLSVRVQGAYRVRSVRTLGPEPFWPRPKVDSKLVVLDRRTDLASGATRERVADLAARLLRQRRKALGGLLADRVGRPRGAELLAELGLEATRRPATLTEEELAALAERLPAPDA